MPPARIFFLYTRYLHHAPEVPLPSAIPHPDHCCAVRAQCTYRPSVAAIDPARPTNGGWRRKNKVFKVPIPDPELFTLAVSHKSGYPDNMILSFRDRRTKRFAEGKRVKAFGGFEMKAHKRLRLLYLARHIQALRALPGNRLEALSGDRAGQYSIRINDQWRICFEWPDGAPGPSNVEIVDYH